MKPNIEHLMVQCYPYIFIKKHMFIVPLTLSIVSNVLHMYTCFYEISNIHVQEEIFQEFESSNLLSFSPNIILETRRHCYKRSLIFFVNKLLSFIINMRL